MSHRPRRRAGLAIVACAVAALIAPAGAAAQSPLLTVGVDATGASLNQATYVLYVANRGTAPAAGVVLTNDIPANTTFVSSDRTPRPPAAGEACSAAVPAGSTARCRWTIGDLAPGASATVSVTYALADGDSTYDVSNTASAQAGEAEPSGSDPSDTDTTLRRTSNVLDVDAHVDDTKPDTNFGGCDKLNVRRDNAVTAFLDSNMVSRPAGTAGYETLWAAELTAGVDSTAAGMPIAVHRVTSHNWTEGTGGCAGANGSNRDARAPSASEPDTEPQSEASATASATPAGPGPLAWDVKTALDATGERLNFEGFELRTASSGGAGADTAVLSSSEAASNAPRLVTVGTAAENSRCVDSDPETVGGPSDREQRIDVYVTDGGAPVGDRTGLDACPGFPVADSPVGFEIDDDDPDAYISSLAGSVPPRQVGSAGDAGPNEGSARTDAGGNVFAAVRLARPYAEGANTGQTRVAAIALHVNRDTDLNPAAPATGRTAGSCEPGTTQAGFGGVPTPCTETGESLDEDDVLVSWEAVPQPPGGGGPGPGTDGGGGPGPGGDPTESISEPQRSIVLSASRAQAPIGQAVELHGQLSSPVAECARQREFVQILRRRNGAREFTDFASVTTDPDGSFDLPVRVDASGAYVAVAATRRSCGQASSPMVEVLARGSVRARAKTAGRSLRIHGRVSPKLRSSVVLERRAGRGWARVASQRLRRGSTFSFALRPDWRGSRTFRVRWRSPSAMYQSAVSKKLRVKAGPAR